MERVGEEGERRRVKLRMMPNFSIFAIGNVEFTLTREAERLHQAKV